MTAIYGELIIVGDTNVPFPAPVLVEGGAVLLDGVIKDGVFEAPGPVAPSLAADRGGALYPGFFGDYFSRVYIIPSLLSLIDPSIGTPNQFFIWNTNFGTVSVTAIDGTDDTGLTINADLPLALGGIKLTTASITVGDDAPDSESAVYEFTISDGNVIRWLVDILRTNLLSIAPDRPVTEVMKWKTVVDAAEDGTEQRSTLTSFARIEHQVDFLMTTDADAKELFEQFATQATETFSYPLWCEPTRLLAAVAPGDGTLQLDTTMFDLQPGDQLFFITTDETISESVRVQTINVDGVTVTLAAGFINAWTLDDPVYRVTTVILQDKPQISRPPFGYIEAKVTLRQTEFRDLFAPGITPTEAAKADVIGDRILDGTLHTLQSVPILHARPIVDSENAEAFDWNFEIIDYDIGAFMQVTNRAVAAVTWPRKYYSTQLIQKFYWNYILNWCHGQRRPVWLPTWMNEIGPEVFDIAGNTILTNSEKFANHYPNDNAFGGVWIAYNGGWIARRIIEIGTDGDGHSIISLDTAVPDDFPTDGPWEVSFLILARQATDEVQREWYPFYNFLTTSFVGTKTTPELT